MPESMAWWLPANVDPYSVRVVNGVLIFEVENEDRSAIYVVRTEEDVLVADPVAQRLTLNDKQLSLSAVPTQVLLEFTRSPTAYLTATHLYEKIWNGHFGSVKTRAVDYAVHRARKQLPPGWLKSVPRLGWRLLP